MTAPAFAIEADGLSRAFGSRLAVDGLTLQVPAGQVFGFVGPNGAGKTTTIRLLLGLLEPTAGEARVLGRDVRTDGPAIRAACGVLLEHAGLYERLSARDNLEFYARVARLPAPDRRTRIAELLDELGLASRQDELVGRWSRGMRQRLAIARAVLSRPRLLFLDEPTAGLDPVVSAALRRELTALAARDGVTVFLTTHNLAEAEAICDRVAVVRAGRLLGEGAPRALAAGYPTFEGAFLAMVAEDR